jgi:hypothetical protein
MFIMPSFAKGHVSTMRWLTLLVVFALTGPLIGCERKEKVLDIKAPGVDVEVNKTDRGIEVESKTKRNP